MTHSQGNEDQETSSARMSSEDEREYERRLWQGDWDAASTAVVLDCVFARLAGPELWACGRVCRSWRRAAAAPALWRRLLRPAASPRALRALSAATETDEGRSEWSWRKEYALQKARWERCDHLVSSTASSAPLLCADLHNSGTYLALVDEDARVTIYERVRPKAHTAEAEWVVQWSDMVKTEWRSISFAQWAPEATNLLLGGRLALVDRFELLCIHFDEDWQSKIICRSASGPGGAGCWVDDYNFLSMRLQLLAPGHACTTVWLNAASQETYSEFAGVTAPLLRIYNEASTHISHILVANVSEEKETLDDPENTVEPDLSEPSAAYYDCSKARNLRKGKTQRVLVAAGGVEGGVRGEARALLAWKLPALEMPVLWVEDHLAQRVQRHRLRLEAASEPEPEPDVDLLRALCSPPTASCPLPARILGLVIHPHGGCVWATTAAGATCASLPSLRPLLQLPRPATCDLLLPPHYVFPAVDDDYFVTPTGGGSGLVAVWAARSARSGALLRHAAPALAAFLLPRRARCRRLLVLTADGLHVSVHLTTAY